MINFSTDPAVAEQQMHAIIFYLTAFGYVDGDFDRSEKAFIREYIAKLVAKRADEALGATVDKSTRDELVGKWTSHFHEELDRIDHGIQADFAEPVAEGEDSRDFVIARLKLRCFELFKGFDEENRSQMLVLVDELMLADGVIHPNERKFRDELFELINAPMELEPADLEPLEPGSVVVDKSVRIAPKQLNHPFFSRTEFEYERNPDAFRKQAAQDLDLVKKTMDKLDEQRARGKGKLGDAVDVKEFAGQDPFLDGHVYVHPMKPKTDCELLVLGDLHGCYSCLKAALLQADFFQKVQAYHDDPVHNPDMKLVLLGDYIDRGRFSYNGILRAVMQLFLAVPEHVYMLRGNHEYYVELNGRVYGGVRPAEAINALQDIAPQEVFRAYRNLFEALPNVLLFDRMMFVHAGIPRDDTVALKWLGLSSLNDAEMRFQMLWSDPSDADYIPLALQQSNARFPFGRLQFKKFMSRLGCSSMVRGHERVTEGFKTVYDDGDVVLLNLFSAGGATNNDLPLDSNYREITPMALTIRYQDGIAQLTPFEIDYARYNDPEHNAFFRASLVT
jgi:uncharacterized tellurite resistance protein B-like protein